MEVNFITSHKRISFYLCLLILVFTVNNTHRVSGFLSPSSPFNNSRRERLKRYTSFDDYEEGGNLFSETDNNQLNSTPKIKEPSLSSNNKKLKREVLGGKKVVMKGKDKRGLRALANQMKAESALHTIQQSINNIEKSVPTISECLTAHKLVNIKVIGGEVKKKMVKEIAEDISERTGSQIIQVVGHTYILYKSTENKSNPFIEI